MNTNEVKTTRIVPVADEAAAAEPNPTPIPIKVWLVDDNDQYRTLLAKYLAQHGGIECPRDFRSPDGALSALASRPGPDVLLLDIHMRDRNGLDAVAPIKALSSSTRVLMLTTLYDNHYHTRALEEGASGFLLKSYSLDQIIEEIRKPELPGQVRRRRRRTCASQALSQQHTAESQPRRSKWWHRLSRVALG